MYFCFTIEDEPAGEHGKMRILTAHYLDSADFLGAYNPDYEGGALFYPTRMPLFSGEAAIVDIRLPGVPNPTLARVQVRHVDSRRGGAWLSFDPEDAPTRDFLLGVARGRIEVRLIPRKTSRFPVEMQVDWQVGDSDDLYISSTDDVSWGGIFVRTLTPPPVGTPVSVVIAVPGGETLRLRGRVTRTATHGAVGMAVRFLGESSERRQLRRLLRRMDLRGELIFPN
jgi:Tfp pilus assembly protein PilZ